MAGKQVFSFTDQSIYPFKFRDALCQLLPLQFLAIHIKSRKQYIIVRHGD